MNVIQRGVVIGAALAAMTCAFGATTAMAQEGGQFDREITIGLNETVRVRAPGVKEIFMGNLSVVGANYTGGFIEFIGRQEGATTATVTTYDDELTVLIRVVPVNPIILAEEVREILGDRSGVTVREVNGRVLIEGEVSSLRYEERINQLVKLYPSQLLNFATYRESFVESAKMVALELDFVQLAVTDRDELGVKWGQFVGANYAFGSGDVPLFYGEDSGAIGDGILPGEVNPQRLPRAVTLTGGSGLNQYFALVGNLNVALDFMVEHGMIRNRQHGILVTEAGTEGEYQAGGTLLVRVASVGATALERIPYGLLVQAKPVVDDRNRVKVEINVRFDEIDQANGIDGVPALRSAAVKGVVNMQEGQSVLVSGLTSVQETSVEQGWWLLSRIPLLGWAFKSRAYLSQQLDNALFITPRLYEPGTQVHRTLVDAVFKQMLDEGVDVDELPELSDAPVRSPSSSSSSPATSSPGGGGDGGGDGLEFDE